MILRLARGGASWLAVAVLFGCGGATTPAPAKEYGWLRGGEPRGLEGAVLRVDWSERLTPEFQGPYEPVEYAVPALDPRRDRVFVGTTAGVLHAMSSSGRRLYRYDAGAGIEAPPALDGVADELYVASEDGLLHALHARDGAVRWKERVEGPLRQSPALSDDAVYVVTDSGRVVALARDDGSRLWSYRRDPPEGFSITGHAGLTLDEERGALLAGFTDGTIAAIDATDGRVRWERETALDLEERDTGAPQFLDVDTTPLLIDDTIYAASFAAGLYGLDPSNGSVRWRRAGYTGITGFTRAGRWLVAASADRGVMCIDLEDRSVRWQRQLARGAPTQPAVAGRTVLVGESRGSMLALSLDSGRELARIHAGNGFSAPAAVAGSRGFVVSNGGALYAFLVRR